MSDLTRWRIVTERGPDTSRLMTDEYIVEDDLLQQIADAYQTWRDAIANPIDVEHVKETSTSFFALLDGVVDDE